MFAIVEQLHGPVSADHSAEELPMCYTEQSEV